MITLQQLSVSAHRKEILRDITFTFERGKTYAIMGPNGSGKSTLAYAMMGHPGYAIAQDSKILLDNKDITKLEPHERSEQGLFLSFQTPLSLSGVKLQQLLHIALQGKKDPVSIRNEIQEYAEELKIRDDLLNRSLNDAASGGERKKLEVLQAAVLDKSVMIFDEVDTGVDVDGLKNIADFLKTHKGEKTYILITHYNRILRYLRPDRVLILVDGKVQRVGNYTLAEDIERGGYAE